MPSGTRTRSTWWTRRGSTCSCTRPRWPCRRWSRPSWRWTAWRAGKAKKINLGDTPGFNMFVHEAKMALPAVESAIVAVDGVAGVEVEQDQPGGHAGVQHVDL